MRTAVWIGTTFLFAACTLPLRTNEAAKDLELRLAAATGDSLTLVLRNESSEEVGFNLCPSALERRAGATWEPVPSERICTMELRLLPSGGEARYTLSLPAGLAAGEYRYSASVQRMQSGTPVSLKSDVFQVRTD